MKTYALDQIASADQANAALTAALPGQSSPWILRATDGDAIAYFDIVSGDTDLVGPAITADISGRHYNEDEAVVAVLAALQKKLGGVIKSDE